MRDLGMPGAATGLEHEDRLVGIRLRHPAPDRSATQPLVFERAELSQVVVALDVFERIEVELLRSIEPERAAGRRIEVEPDDLADVSIEPLAGGGRSQIGAWDVILSSQKPSCIRTRAWLPAWRDCAKESRPLEGGRLSH